MIKKDLHIVFGPSGKANLSRSQIVNKDHGDILGFDDPLSLGPLCDLDEMEHIENRKLWLKRIFDSFESEDGSNFVDANLNQIRTLLQTIRNYKSIYLWLGNYANEKLTTARLLSHLQGLTIPIFKADFAKAEFKNGKGEDIKLISLQVMKEADVLELGKHFEELSEQDKRSFISLWEQLQKDKSVIHLFDKEDNCISKDESFFDNYLLNRCSDQSKKSAFVVAYTLFDIWDEWGRGEVGDGYLYYRLNVLEKEGKVEITDRHENSERGRQIFNVRRV